MKGKIKMEKINVKLTVAIKSTDDKFNKILNNDYTKDITFEVNDVPEYLHECLKQLIGEYTLINMNFNDLRNLAYTKSTFKAMDKAGFIYTITDNYNCEMKKSDFSYLQNIVNK